MASYAISNVPRRVVYAASGVGPYAFTFEILTQNDIAVYEGDTLQTLTTDYTVTINANGTGSVTLVSAASDNITIVGSKTIQRTTDFTTGGDFFANTLNDELDAQTIFIQQIAETAERGLKAPVTDPTDVNMTLPRKADRANKFLAFNSVGDPVPGQTPPELDTIYNNISYIQTIGSDLAGTGFDYDLGNVSDSSGGAPAGTPDGYLIGVYNALDEIAAVEGDIANINIVAGISSDITTVAGISADVTAVAGVNSVDLAAVAAIASDVTAVSNISASVTTVAANIVDVQNAEENADAAIAAQAAAESARDATLAALDSFDDRYLGSKTSDPALDNDGNALISGALYFNSTDGVMKVYTGSAWVSAYAPLSGALLVANNLSDLNSAASARTNLGLGSIATQSAASVNITGGSVNGTTIGASTAAAGTFTDLTVTGTFDCGSIA